MARPARFNADYFTHSADLRNDRRVKAIRTAYGVAGYGIFIMLLEALTDADNTALAVDEMELELLAGDFGVSATDIRSLSQFGIKVGYFATNGAGFLTCPDLNSWLAPVFEKRNRARNAAPAALLPHPVSETGVSVTVIPQSKVKESRVENKHTPSLRSVRGVRADMEAFDAFWKNYPRKEAKADALRAFGKLKPEQQSAAAEWAKAYFSRRPIAEWFAPDGRDVRPHPATWLNGERWTDLLESASAGPGPRLATPDPETDRLRAFTEEQAAMPAPVMVYRSAPNKPAHLQTNS